jgi:hypothetical protein
MMSSLNQTSDKPQSFGYKVSWFAVKAPHAAAVIDALELKDAVPANWTSGIAAANPDTFSPDGDRWLFVSPSINGWVLAVGSWLPYPTAERHHDIGAKFDTMFALLATRFDDVQFFGSHRVSDYCAWARAANGKPVRVFAYGGEVLMNLGGQTPEEAKLGLPDLSGLSLSDAEDKIFAVAEELDAEQERLAASGLSQDEAYERAYSGRHAFPTEEDVIGLAAFWSVDPTQLSDEDRSPGSGLAVRLPDNMRQ